MAPGEEGFTDQLRRLGTAVLRSAENRLALFGVELQEEKIRFLQLIILALAGCACAFLGVLALIALIFWLLPEGGRGPFLGLVILGCLAGGWICFRVLSSRLSQSQFFSGTRAELGRDRQCLETQN